MTSDPSRTELRYIARRAMRERDLWPDFSDEALVELGAMKGPATGPPGAVRDLRDLLWASIDNDDSRDLDQISVAGKPEGGRVKILVGIADVDSLVKKGSAIDRHAAHNTTSVYTGAVIFPMLPERLSTDLTSLGEHQDRLAMVVEMSVDAEGGVGGAEIYPALVRNRAKLAYRGVSEWLDGGALPEAVAATPGVGEQLCLQDQVAQRLRRRRHERGSLELWSTETRPVFDREALVDLLPEERNRAKALIEDLMIAANGVTARFLGERQVPSLRRVVRAPKRWERIVQVAAQHGEELPGAPDAAALQRFLEKQRQADPLRFPDLSLVIIKLLGPGEYTVELPGGPKVGHFGLAVRDYTHSTAPNRRYSDLVTQRQLKAALAGGPAPYTVDELVVLADRCTKKEDDANKVERRVRKSAAALLLRPRVGERFDAIVTGASAKGTWVRLPQPPVEGRLVQGAEGLDVGDRVGVRLVGTDVERGYIDFARA